MKTLTSLGISLLLATAGGAALADRDGGHVGSRDKGGGQWHHHGHHTGYWYPPPVHPPRHYRGGGYDPLDAALIGAAVSYGLFYDYDVQRCVAHYCTNYPIPSRDAAAMGCYRIERYPDGQERRLKVPDSECN